MKTLKKSKIVLLFLLISVGCKKEDQIKTTITPTSVVYEDTSLNSYVQIDSTTLIGVYGGSLTDTSFIFDIGDYLGEATFEKKSPQFTNTIKRFQITFFVKNKYGRIHEDTTVEIIFQCGYSDTNTLENFKKYDPIIGNYPTRYFEPSTFNLTRESLALTFNVNWAEDIPIMGPRYYDFYPNPDNTVSTIKQQKLCDGNNHLVLEINRKLDDSYAFITGKSNTATFKARIVLN